MIVFIQSHIRRTDVIHVRSLTKDYIKSFPVIDNANERQGFTVFCSRICKYLVEQGKMAETGRLTFKSVAPKDQVAEEITNYERVYFDRYEKRWTVVLN